MLVCCSDVQNVLFVVVLYSMCCSCHGVQHIQFVCGNVQYTLYVVCCGHVQNV